MVCQECVDIVKEFEGIKLKAYLCPANVVTIGYGSTKYPDGKKIKMGDVITLSKAEDMLRYDLGKFEDGVKKLIKVKLNDYQIGALTSFAYNVGLGNLKSSTLLKKLNANDIIGASLEFGKWNKANGKVLAGLARRRKAEYYLFLKV